MQDSQDFGIDERVTVAKDLEAIIERAARETGFVPDTTLGYFYYEHPLRTEQTLSI